jgi:NAD(P)-dependent dehydrogenase (short-subunit alcohol dehydrogenase family)
MDFKGKVAVITGAAAGIGRATAILFAEHGAAVGLIDRHASGVEETAELVGRSGGQAFAVSADVGIEAEVIRAFQQLAPSLKRIDLLINNAGVELYKDFLQYESVEWDRLLAVNLNSVYYCSKQAIPFMIQSGEGSIVNLSSVQALATTGQVSPYAAAKGGILSLTRDMAREFGKHKIRVNSICPGCIHTPMMDRTLATMADADTVVKRMAQAIPLQRLGKAEDIAKVALFLSSSYADYISGTALVVDGGLLSKLPLPEYW